MITTSQRRELLRALYSTDQQGPTRQTLLVTTEVRAEIDNHPLIRAFLSQIQLDEWKSRSIDLNPEDIEKSKG